MLKKIPELSPPFHFPFACSRAEVDDYRRGEAVQPDGSFGKRAGEFRAKLMQRRRRIPSLALRASD